MIYVLASRATRTRSISIMVIRIATDALNVRDTRSEFHVGVLIVEKV